MTTDKLSGEAFLRDFAGDLTADKARVLYAMRAPFKRTLLAGKTAHAAWRSKPRWYAVSTEDRTIDPDPERFMAKGMGAKTIEVKANHLSLISDVITNLILDAAGQTQGVAKAVLKAATPLHKSCSCPLTESGHFDFRRPGPFGQCRLGRSTTAEPITESSPSWFCACCSISTR